MINMLIGAPGGGKSYEAVAYHVIPALSAGRKVITNLPLVLDAFPPEWKNLLDVRVTKGLHRPFSKVEDFGDTWRHEEKGYGALYVIDECHYPFRRGKTPQAIQEWFSEHRHELCDVLLMTQSYGKVDKEICDMVQLTYRVRKAVAFGFTSKYTRKVYDGIRGDCVNTDIRAYDKKFFKYYKSHTKSSAAGQESGASDVSPIYKRWPFLAAPVFLIAAGVLFARNGANPMTAMQSPAKSSTQTAVPKQAPAAPVEVRAGTSTPQPATMAAAPAAAPPPPPDSPVKLHPLQGYGVHIAGFITNPQKTLYTFVISQNGQASFTMDQEQMKNAGYEIVGMASCVVRLKYEGTKDFFAVCDMPQVHMAPEKNVPTATKT